ncbi:MAG: hypothetical protein ACN6OS_07410 [Comamonas testosteroni]|uniref:hypothetical protein n=1 Tax=Comamonas testosteroni TaxID=285 RepID=UPI003D0B488F
MSDDSELYFLEHENRPTRTELESNSSPYLLSEWHLPIVWVALFQPWDARIDATPFEMGIEHTSRQSDTTPLPT